MKNIIHYCSGGRNSNVYKDIFMIDTQNLFEFNGEEDQQIIDLIRAELKAKHCTGIKSIILFESLHNSTSLSHECQKLLSIYCKIFPNP